MKVIRLRYSQQPDLINGICDLIRPTGDQVDSESEEVLTLWVTPDGTIQRLVPPPRCKLYRGVEGGDLFA